MNIGNDSVDGRLSCETSRAKARRGSFAAHRNAVWAVIFTGILSVSAACGSPLPTLPRQTTASPTAADSAPSVPVAGFRLAAGMDHTCTLSTSGGMRCWGDNTVGELGDGVADDPEFEGGNSRIAVEVVGLTSGTTSIAAGGSQTCAIGENGTVYCWGAYVPVGGDGSTEFDGSPVELLDESEDVAALSIGGGHACLLTGAGAVRCWGENEVGQLGDGTTRDSGSLVDVIGLSSGVIAVSAGYRHTCALGASGGVKCWGEGWTGVLGNGGTQDSSTPVDVSGLTSGVTAISALGSHACAVTQAGGVKCWGLNKFGQLGDGTTKDSSIPVEALGPNAGIKGVTAAFFQTCALTDAGGVKCWGRNNVGQLGDGTTTRRKSPPEGFSISSGAVEIAIGFTHACALTTTDAVKCWGGNQKGQLGNGRTANSRRPVNVLGLDTRLGTVAQYASLVEPYTGIVEELDKLGPSECDWSTPGQVDRVSSAPYCRLAATNAQLQAQTLALTLRNAQKEGSRTYIGRPPDEIEELVAETIQAADNLADAWAKAEPCMTAPDVGCDAHFLMFLSSGVDMHTQIENWNEQGID